MQNNLEKLSVEISNNISKELNLNPKYNIGLLSGKSGIILFYYHLYKYTNNEKYFILINSLLNDVLEQINKGEFIFTHCSGISGFAWLIQYLEGNNFIENKEAIEIFEQIDNILLEIMYKYGSEENFDFLHGSIGIGLYFIKKEILKKEIFDALSKQIKFLYNSAIKYNDETFQWKFNQERNDNLVEFNFGMAHGMASIISFLCLVYEKNIEKELCAEMINGAIKRILICKQLTNSTYFSTGFLSNEELLMSNNRLAWCYGNLGTALSLYQAGDIINNELWKNEAINAFKVASKRRDLKEAGIDDACVCHGTAGIALIYKIIYNKTQILEFKETSEFWLNETLKMKVEIDIFKYWSNIDEKHVHSINILEGLSGIGLTFLTFLSDIKWADSLLIK